MFCMTAIRNVVAIFYQVQYMQTVFDMYPEVVMVDSTYKLLNLRMPVFIFLGVDGNGLSETFARRNYASDVGGSGMLSTI